MAVVTWDGSSSTAYSTAANWDTGSVPADGDDVVIPDTSSINACNVDSNDSCNSLTVLSNGEIGSDNGSKLAILGEADGTGATTNGFGVNIDGAITDNGGTSLDIDIRTPAATTIDLYAQGGGKLRNIIINHASCVATLGALIDITGNLTITAGELNTNSGSNYAVTVAGATSITGTLTCNSSTISLGAAVTSGYALTVNDGGTFTGGTGTHTIGSFNVSGSGSGGSMTLSSSNTTISSRNTSQNRFFEVSSNSNSFANGSGTLIFTTAAGSNIVLNKSGATLNNVQINHASCVVTLLTTAITISGNLTITAGELDTGPDDVALTVTGDASVTGTLTGNASAISLGSLTIASGGTYSATSGTTTITGEAGSGYAIEVLGTYTANAGTLKITTDANTLVKILDDVNHLNIEAATATRVYEWVNNTTIQGNLTVNAGRFAHYSSLFSLDVQGDCTINNTGILDGGSGSIELGSLTIASGGEYRATTGTTTVTGESGSGVNLSNSGTFTHNQGTIKVTCATQTSLVGFSGTNAFYNYTYAGTGSGQDQVCGGNTDFFGQVIIDSANSEVQMQAHTFNLYGGITIKQGGWDIGSSDTSGTVNVYGSVRNVGGTVVAS